MLDFYINQAYNDPLMNNNIHHAVHPNTDFYNNNINNTAIDFFKRYKNVRENTYNLYKTIR